MKVYKSLCKVRIGAIDDGNRNLIGGFKGCDVGELLFYHEGMYKPKEGGYGLMVSDVENNPSKFKRMKDLPKSYKYYTHKKYTQEYVDKLLKTKK